MLKKYMYLYLDVFEYSLVLLSNTVEINFYLKITLGRKINNIVSYSLQSLLKNTDKTNEA